MPKIRKHHKKRNDEKYGARTIKKRVVLLISFLVIVALVLIFKVGQDFWPGWMVEYRKPIMGLVLFAAFILIAASPLVIEADSNSRPLSGPGHNPKLPRSFWNP